MEASALFRMRLGGCSCSLQLINKWYSVLALYLAISLSFCLFQELEKALKMFNFFFTAAFCLEAALKVAALGLERYFSEKYDFRHMTA